MSDNDRAGRIRYQYLSQFGDEADLPVELLHQMAADIAGQCGHTLLKVHRLAGTALPVVCLSGQAGVRKTTLAIHVAHRVGGEFPGGQLYTNLRGADMHGQDPAEVLAAIIGEARAQTEPEAVKEIARMCGYLPLALRIAGARLLSRPTWKVSWFATRLADESRRLDLLKAGDLEVRASFGLSYYGRAEAEQHAFRMLSLLPADFPAWNLAAVLGTDPDDAEELLEQLVDAVLVDVAGVDATGLIRYRLASALVHPGAPDPGTAPAPPLLMEDVVRGDPGVVHGRTGRPRAAGRASPRLTAVGADLAARRTAAGHVRLAGRLAFLGAHSSAGPRCCPAGGGCRR